jgi:hypothetical protein
MSHCAIEGPVPLLKHAFILQRTPFDFNRSHCLGSEFLNPRRFGREEANTGSCQS